MGNETIESETAEKGRDYDASGGSLMHPLQVPRFLKFTHGEELICDDSLLWAFFYSICSLGGSFPPLPPSPSLLSGLITLLLLAQYVSPTRLQVQKARDLLVLIHCCVLSAWYSGGTQ